MSQPATLSIDFAVITDIGCARSNNEDSFGYDAERQIFVVCDGMGGSAAGEVASNMAVRTLIETFGAGDAETPVENRLLFSVLEANRAVRHAGMADPALHSMGTTLVCLCVDGNRVVIANVGDSRAYLLRNGSCQQITQDHSLLDEKRREGTITAEIATAANLQSVITRAIGVEDTVEPDLFAAQIQADDMLLLASDGLTRYAEAEQILEAARSGMGLSGICQTLIDYAKACGGVDNITCFLLRAFEPAAAASSIHAVEDSFPAI